MLNVSHSLTPTQFSQAIKDLRVLVSIPSVSHPNSPDYSKNHLFNASTFLCSKLLNLGFKVYYSTIEKSDPFIIAERIVNIAKPTFLLYAHYDVQPVDRQQWATDPFVLVERDGRLYGRGASDDKAGIIAITTAIQHCIEEKIELPNIKILFEGEEEYGSVHMSALLKQEAELIHAQALIVLDGINRDVNTGTLNMSARGIVNIELEVTALEKPVHSGIGCLVPDPAQVLANLIHSLKNPRDIPGFMDGVEELKETEKEILKKNSISAEIYAKNMEMKPKVQLRGNANDSVYERILSEPSISVVNMTCGQPNGGNSIQDKARCTISIRVLPGQDPDQVAAALIKYLEAQTLESQMEVKMTQLEKGAWAWKADLSARFSKMYLQSLKENFSEVCAMPCGGALPLIHEFKQIFPDMEIIIPGVEDPDTHAHSHNESQHIALFKKTIETLIHFLKNTGQLTLTT